MKKFITLLSAAFIAVASLATVASAAPMTTDTYEPKAVLDIVALDEGAAVVQIGFEVNEDLGLTNVGSKYVPKYTGYAFTAWQIDIDFNKEILNADEAYVFNPVAGSYNGDFTLALGSTDKLVDMGIAVIPVQAAYADLTAEELNKLDFATVTYAEAEITNWNEATAAKNFLTQTSYRSDGKGDFPVASRIGVDAPVDTKTWKENVSWSDPDDANKTAIWWGFDIAAETFGDHQFVTVTDGADVPKTKTVGIGLADGYEVSGEGNVSFAVAVILDKADVTDKFDAYLGR